jgi:hypothetical protein
VALGASVYLLFLFSVLFFTAIGKEKAMPIAVILTLVIAVGIFIGYMSATTIKGLHQYLQISKGKPNFHMDTTNSMLLYMIKLI